MKKTAKIFYPTELTMKKEDARITKTKAKLVTALKELLSEKSFEDITVNEICERADIRRATFYKSFSDKYAFLKYLVGTLRDDFDKSLSRSEQPVASSSYYIEYIRAIANYLTQNEEMVANILKSEALHLLMGVIEEKNYEDTCERLRKSVGEGLVIHASVETVASMMTGAVTSTILRWIINGRRIPVENLVEEISAVIKVIAPRSKEQ